MTVITDIMWIARSKIQVNVDRRQNEALFFQQDCVHLWWILLVCIVQFMKIFLLFTSNKSYF